MNDIAQFAKLLMENSCNPFILAFYTITLAFIVRFIAWLFSRDGRRTISHDLSILKELEAKESKCPEDEDLKNTISVLRSTTYARVRKLATRKDTFMQFVKYLPMTSLGVLGTVIYFLLALADGSFSSMITDFGLFATVQFMTICCVFIIGLSLLVDVFIELVRFRLLPHLAFLRQKRVSQKAIDGLRKQMQEDISFDGYDKEMLQRIRISNSDNLDYWVSARGDIMEISTHLESSIQMLSSIKAIALGGKDELDEFISNIRNHITKATAKRLPTLEQQREAFMEAIIFADSYLPQYTTELQIEKEILCVINKRIDALTSSVVSV